MVCKQRELYIHMHMCLPSLTPQILSKRQERILGFDDDVNFVILDIAVEPTYRQNLAPNPLRPF